MGIDPRGLSNCVGDYEARVAALQSTITKLQAEAEEAEGLIDECQVQLRSHLVPSIQEDTGYSYLVADEHAKEDELVARLLTFLSRTAKGEGVGDA